MTGEDKRKVLEVLDGLMEGTKGVVRATIEDCRRAIGKMKEDDGWIPVTERLPDIGKDVLIYSKEDGVDVDYYGGEMFGYYDVTHWMPLPEPPKEEGR